MKPDSSRDASSVGNLGFTYRVKSIIDGNTIEIGIEFDNPSEISMSDGYDFLEIEVKADNF